MAFLASVNEDLMHMLLGKTLFTAESSYLVDYFTQVRHIELILNHMLWLPAVKYSSERV